LYHFFFIWNLHLFYYVNKILNMKSKRIFQKHIDVIELLNY